MARFWHIIKLHLLIINTTSWYFLFHNILNDNIICDILLQYVHILNIIS